MNQEQKQENQCIKYLNQKYVIRKLSERTNLSSEVIRRILKNLNSIIVEELSKETNVEIKLIDGVKICSKPFENINVSTFLIRAYVSRHLKNKIHNKYNKTNVEK